MDKNFIQTRYAAIRNAHKISARKLSFELGQSSEYINQIENGKNLPSLESLLNFCDFFHISPAEFFDENIQYPVEYKAMMKEINKLTPDDCNLIIELLKTINRNS